jgi:hypothetical protein
VKAAVNVALYGSIGTKICVAAAESLRSDVNFLNWNGWAFAVNDFCIRHPLNRIMRNV